eukprot:CAMPEP_0119483548 /NCGR_PEP_ID=MMETSP1344-20130328/10911_1 /TAXON_ID=236787 /ORGANISM="Florenciella parvula, Strain CCMP2471" /LENGTH=34 /DNA_ID= /DNA_START= /DNA_END= /DNA_ORIENTATION=
MGWNEPAPKAAAPGRSAEGTLVTAAVAGATGGFG